jgi:hypothetical protein
VPRWNGMAPGWHGLERHLVVTYHLLTFHL